MAAVNMIPYGRVRYKTRQHPLFQSWRRIRSYYTCDDAWGTFAQFAADVGIQPHLAKIKRKDETQPYGPDNWCWKAPAVIKGTG